MSDDDKLMEDLLDEARFDWMDMGNAIGVVAVTEGDNTDLALLQRAGSLVVQLVRAGRLVPGEIGSPPGRFDAWPMDPEVAAKTLAAYFDSVVAGKAPFEPWRPCLFAAAGVND